MRGIGGGTDELEDGLIFDWLFIFNPEAKSERSARQERGAVCKQPGASENLRTELQAPKQMYKGCVAAL